MNLFSSVESDKAGQVREAIDDFGTSNTTKSELRRSDQNQPETSASARLSEFSEPSTAENRMNACDPG